MILDDIMNNKEFNDEIDSMIEFVLKELHSNKTFIFDSPGNTECFERKLLALSKLKELKYPEENSIKIENHQYAMNGNLDNDIKAKGVEVLSLPFRIHNRSE